MSRMNNDIFEVSRDEYVGFLSQINPNAKDSEVQHLEDCTIIKTISKNTGTHLCTRIISEEQGEHYYVFNMPLTEERIPPKPVRKIVLTDKKEVEAFLNALSKISKGDIK